MGSGIKKGLRDLKIIRVQWVATCKALTYSKQICTAGCNMPGVYLRGAKRSFLETIPNGKGCGDETNVIVLGTPLILTNIMTKTGHFCINGQLCIY